MKQTTMKHLLVLGAVLTGAGAASAGTTYYWSPKVQTAVGTSQRYRWNTASNWVTTVGNESTRGLGYPTTGDTAVLGETQKYSEAYQPNGENEPLYALIVGPKSAININQGGYGLLGGGAGFQFTANSSLTGNWSYMAFYGDGEVPIDIVNNVFFAMQTGIKATGGNPVIVKKGKGRFVCFNEGGSTYTVKLTRIQQGSWDMSTKGSFSGLTIAFDGNDESQRLQYGYAAGWGTGLTFKDSAIIETNGVANTGHGIYDNNRGRQIAFTGAPKVNPMVFSGTFYGKAGLRWSPSDAKYTFVCSNAVSATGGKFSVEKGTVKLVTGASLTALGELAVSAGAVFEVEEGSGSGLKATTLTIGDTTAQLKLPAGVSLAINDATVKGVAISPGTYTANGGEGCKKAAWIVGAGEVVVATGPEAAFTWQGGAAEGDSIALADNWTDGGTPDLKSGTLLATFAQDGSTASLPAGEGAAFSGIVLDKTGGGAFAFTAGEGSVATVGVTAVTAASSAATAWQMGWPLFFAGDQTLTIGANDTLTLAGGFAGADALAFAGAGQLNLTAPAAHTGALTLNGGTVRVLATDALGAASRTVAYDIIKVNVSFGGEGTVIGCPLYLKNDSGKDTSSQGLTVEENASVTFNGMISTIGDQMVKVGAGATATFAGGYQGNATSMNGRIYPRGSGTIVVTNGTIQLPFQIQSTASAPVNFEFWSTGNKFNRSRYYNWSTFAGRLATRVKDAFAAQTWVQLVSASAVFDLCGLDQTVNWFHSCAGARVTSEKPATLTMLSLRSDEYNDNSGAGDSNRVDRATFEGAVSVVKKGVMPHAFGAVSSSTGSVTVTEGILTFASDGSWPNAAKVSVTGGTLKLQNPDAFGEKTVWSLASTATLNLDHAGTNFVDRVYVDGARIHSGIYAAPDATAEAKYRPEWLKGTGVLSVKEHGLMLILR